MTKEDLVPLSRPGQRIRDLRMEKGVRQSDLAQTVGISPSYLNLIEHDRRRIAGRLMAQIARALDVPQTLLTQGADAQVLAEMQSAAAQSRRRPDAARAAELATRYPDWAELVAEQFRQIADLEARLTALTDRLAHDPVLAGSLHDLISAITSIRSTAGILIGDERLDADWMARFHRNIHADALRLAAASDALVAGLDPGHAPDEPTKATPERPDPGVERRAAQAEADAEALPLATFLPAAIAANFNPAKMADLAPPARLLRRLASLPPDPERPPLGLVVCDGAGVLTHLSGVPGFDLPRQGGACPLWPLFTALGQPGRVVQADVALPGPPELRLRCHAIAEASTPARFGHPPVIEATMLVHRDPPEGDQPPLPLGLTCRICPRDNCPARRVPSAI